MRIFPKNPALSLFYIYDRLTSCKKSEKTNEPILRTSVSRTDGRTDDTEFIGPSHVVNVGPKTISCKGILGDQVVLFPG